MSTGLFAHDSQLHTPIHSAEDNDGLTWCLLAHSDAVLKEFVASGGALDRSILRWNPNKPWDPWTPVSIWGSPQQQPWYLSQDSHNNISIDFSEYFSEYQRVEQLLFFSGKFTLPLPESAAIQFDSFCTEFGFRNAQRAMREYVAFFTWWTMITPKRDTEHLKAAQLDQIQALPIDLMACTRKAIIIDLAEDWPHVNIPLWANYRIPVLYRWTSREGGDLRFKRLSPIQDGIKPPFDIFLQDERKTLSNPTTQAKHRVRNLVVDFEGWARRDIADKKELNQLRNCPFILIDNVKSTSRIFFRWRRIRNRASQHEPDSSDEEDINDAEYHGPHINVDKWCKIRERYRRCAPESAHQLYDLDTGTKPTAPASPASEGSIKRGSVCIGAKNERPGDTRDSRELSSSSTSSWSIPRSPSPSTRLLPPQSPSKFSWSGQSASSWEGLASSSPWTQSSAPLASERSTRGSSISVDAKNMRPSDSRGYSWGTSSMSSSSINRSSFTSTRPSRQHPSSNWWSDPSDSPWKDLSSSSPWTQSPVPSAPERPTRGSTVSIHAGNAQLAESRGYSKRMSTSSTSSQNIPRFSPYPSAHPSLPSSSGHNLSSEFSWNDSSWKASSPSSRTQSWDRVVDASSRTQSRPMSRTLGRSSHHRAAQQSDWRRSGGGSSSHEYIDGISSFQSDCSRSGVRPEARGRDGRDIYRRRESRSSTPMSDSSTQTFDSSSVRDSSGTSSIIQQNRPHERGSHSFATKTSRSSDVRLESDSFGQESQGPSSTGASLSLDSGPILINTGIILSSKTSEGNQTNYLHSQSKGDHPDIVMEETSSSTRDSTTVRTRAIGEATELLQAVETPNRNGSASQLRSSVPDAVGCHAAQSPFLSTHIATQSSGVHLLESYSSVPNHSPGNDDIVSLGSADDDVSIEDGPFVVLGTLSTDGSASPLRSSATDAVGSHPTQPPAPSTNIVTAQSFGVRFSESHLSQANTVSIHSPANDDTVSLGSADDDVSMDEDPFVIVETLPSDGSASPLRSSATDAVGSHLTQPPAPSTNTATAQSLGIRLSESHLSQYNTIPIDSTADDDIVSLGSSDDDISTRNDHSLQVASSEKVPDLHNVIGPWGIVLGKVVYAEVIDSLLWDATFLRRAVFSFAEPEGVVNIVSEAMFRYWTCAEPSVTTAQLLSRAIAACLPFRILVPRSSLTVVTSLPVRETINKLPNEKNITKFIALWKDFLKNDLLLRPEARGFLFVGGFVTRLALYFGGAALVRRAQEGPSAEAAGMYGFRLKASNGDTLHDDFVAPAAIDALLGSPAHNFNTKKTLFPDGEALARHFPRYQGVWTQHCEDLFQAILRSFQKKPELRNTREWGRWLRVGEHNKRDEPLIDIKGACTDILQNLELHPPHDRRWHQAPLTSVRTDLCPIVQNTT